MSSSGRVLVPPHRRLPQSPHGTGDVWLPRLLAGPMAAAAPASVCVREEQRGEGCDTCAGEQHLWNKQRQVTAWASLLNVPGVFRLRIVGVVIKLGISAVSSPLPPSPVVSLEKYSIYHI